MNLYWEIDERRLVAGLSDPRVLDRIEMPAGDTVPLRVYLVERGSIADPFSTQALTDGFEIVIAGKETAGSATTLFLEDEFTEAESGAYTYYSAEMDLNTEEIITALTGKKTLTVLLELAWKKTADDSQRYSTAIRLKLQSNIIDTGAVPTSSSSNVKLINNVLHILNTTTGEWCPVTAGGDDGAQHIDLGEGV